MAYLRKVIEFWNTVKQSKITKKINQIISSPLGVAILGILTVLAFVHALEAEFYTFVVIYAIYVALFADDLAPLMPLFVLCYITPSKNNNPGTTTGGLFYGSSGVYLIVIVSIAVLAMILRIVFDKEMGLRRLFTKKRMLLPSMLILGASYLLSGILHPQYAEYAKSNLIFASIQFASVFLLYFIFSATVKWERFNFDYYAAFGLIMGLVVCAEVCYSYLFDNIIIDSSIDRYLLQTGWGCYNNIGAIIAMAIPFAFYFASRKKRNALFLAVACFMFVCVIFTNSRGAISCAVYGFVLPFIYTFIKCENKREFRFASLGLLVLLVVGALICRERLLEIFKNVPNIIDFNPDSIVINDSGRLEYYADGIQVFLRNPIFGQSFYPIEYELYTFATVSEFISFFPPRWHNTPIQMMASCGIVGIAAYLYHRFMTIKLYCKHFHKNNHFLFFSASTLVALSLLDCHFFNVGPTFFYSMTFAVAEFALAPQKNTI